MKKIFTLSVTLLIVALLQINHSLSQTLNNGKSNSTQASYDVLSTPYTFSYSTGTYTNLTGATSLSGQDLWDYKDYPCPIGFTFKFFTIPFDTIKVSDPEDVEFGATKGNYIITAFGSDLLDRGFGSTKPLSPISYTVVDTAPHRILKIEWKNAGFLGEITSEVLSNNTNFINLQLWLYETSNNIEIHFGPHYVTYPDSFYTCKTGPNISLSNNVTSKYISLYGDSTKPSTATISDSCIKGTPPNGMIYKFATDYVGINDKVSRKYYIYPNPVSEKVYIKLPEKFEWANVQVFNLLGNEILNKKFSHTDLINLNVNSLTPGTYLLKLQTPETVITKKITKQ